MFKYQKISEQISKEINNSIYKVGEKLPSIRDVCTIYSCSHMTAVSAFSDLERKGYIQSQERSGHYVLNTKTNIDQITDLIVSYADSNVSNLVSQLLETENDPDILPLGTNVKFENYFPIKKALNLIPLKSDAFLSLYTKYSYPPGSKVLRSQIAKRLHWRDVDVSPKEMIITHGVTEGTYLALKVLTNPGDKVVISSPCFFGILNILEQLKLRVVEVPSCHINGVNLSVVEKVLDEEDIKVGVFQTNFENPKGCLTSNEDKQVLVEMFAKRNAFIVEDDINGELSHSSKLMSNLKSYDKTKDVVFSAGSFSKTMGPGFRVGWLIPCKKYYQKVIKAKLSTSFSGIRINEKILELFLTEGTMYNKQLKQITTSFQENVLSIRSMILNNMFEGCIVSNPQGGFCLWIEFPKKIDSFILYKQLLKEKIAITPGHIFSTKKLYENCIRLNCAIKADRRVENAIQLIFEIAKRQI
ncbi:MAG: PLP-dependent aminotransferase family protein [Candidatus Cloacimonetes bacterium]|nr:PLP-dependent aminotransferase family protein [Candidatus Cloacimonadota bacterium]